MATVILNNSNWLQINKRVLALALPIAFTQVVTVASGFLCMTMLAQLGKEVLAASALIFSAQMSIMVIGMSLLLSLSILIGHAYGAQKYAVVGSFVQQGWFLGLLISCPILLIFWYMKPVLILLGQNKATAQIVQNFFHAYMWRVVPFMLSVCNQQLCYGVHKQKIDAIANFIGVFILLAAAYLLIFGRWELPKFGIAGLAYAMDVQGWFYFLFTTAYFYFGKDFKKFNLFNFNRHKDWSQFTRIFNIGWPISFQMSAEMLWFFVGSAMIGWLGNDALAAYQIVIQYLFLVMIPIFAISQASGVLVGQAYGSKQLHVIKRLGYTSVGIVLVISLMVTIVFIAFSYQLASLYLNIHNPANSSILHMVTLLFIAVAFSQIFDSIRNLLIGSLHGLLDRRYPMFIGILTIWLIGMPFSYFLAFIWHWGVMGIAIGSGAGMLVGAIIMLRRWNKINKLIL